DLHRARLRAVLGFGHALRRGEQVALDPVVRALEALRDGYRLRSLGRGRGGAEGEGGDGHHQRGASDHLRLLGDEGCGGGIRPASWIVTEAVTAGKGPGQCAIPPIAPGTWNARTRRKT